MFDHLIEVEVGTGEGQRTFKVFNGVLCLYSGYFNAALNGRFKEAENGVVKLPTEDRIVFELFRQYIHTRRFYEPILDPSILLDYATITKLWVYGDAHDVPLLQNAVIDILIAKMKDTGALPNEDVLTYVWANTLESSCSRRALVGACLTVYPALACEDADDVVEDYQPDIFEVASRRTTKLFRKTEMKKWASAVGCDFHVHEEDVKCFERVKQQPFGIVRR